MGVLLAWIPFHRRRLTVFLPAAKCDPGVLQAIQSKLEGPAKDEQYLQSLIFAGLLDVIIDGLNEISAYTRVRILQFADSFFKGNLMIAAQPKVWSPPPLAEVYELLPLREEQIETFGGTGNERPERQLGDALFRGTYLQLATRLPPCAARALERRLIEHAADLEKSFGERRLHQAPEGSAIACWRRDIEPLLRARVFRRGFRAVKPLPVSASSQGPTVAFTRVRD